MNRDLLRTNAYAYINATLTTISEKEKAELIKNWEEDPNCNGEGFLVDDIVDYREAYGNETIEKALYFCFATRQRSSDEIARRVDLIVENIAYAFDIPKDFYGDCLPSEVMNLMTDCYRGSDMYVELKLGEIVEILTDYARSYEVEE